MNSNDLYKFIRAILIGGTIIPLILIFFANNNWEDFKEDLFGE